MDEPMNEPVRTPLLRQSMAAVRTLPPAAHAAVLPSSQFSSRLFVPRHHARRRTLIVVMAVMTASARSLLDNIPASTAIFLVHPLESPLTDCKDVADRISQFPGSRLAAPVVDGQGLAPRRSNSPASSSAVSASDDLTTFTSIAKDLKQGSGSRLERGQALRSARRLADQLSLHAATASRWFRPRGR